MRLSLVVGAVVLFAACGGNSEESAGDAMERQFGYAIDGQWSRYYDELHPAHQAIVDRDLYLRCQQGATVPIDSVKAIEVFTEQHNVAEIGTIETKAVTVELRVGKRKDTDTYHEIATADGWRLTLTADALASFRKDECPN